VSLLAAVAACGDGQVAPDAGAPDVGAPDAGGPSYEVTADGTRVASVDGAALFVLAPTDDSVRLRYVPRRTGGALEPERLPSFAVLEAALAAPVTPTITETATVVRVALPRLVVWVDKATLATTVRDPEGRATWLRDVAPVRFGRAERRDALPPLTRSSTTVEVSWAFAADGRVYGLGDKLWGMDRRGARLRFYNTDAFAFQALSDPLYKSVPFFVLVQGGRAAGVFVDNPARGELDVGQTATERLTYVAERVAQLDVHVFAGPEPTRVLDRYTRLTGRPAMPPRWALGYHQSRYSYLSAAEVRDVVARLEAAAFPTDVMWFDIDALEGRRPLVVDAAAFPAMEGLVAELEGRGLRSVIIANAHLPAQPDHAPYVALRDADLLVHTASTGAPIVRPVWPGPCAFPDFTRAAARDAWGGFLAPFVDRYGFAGVWNDMNEPALLAMPKTLPDGARHRLDDGRVVEHVWAHNLFGHLNAAASDAALRGRRPDERPFILTRAAYAGTHRYAATWTGDNVQSWDHLALVIPQLTNLGISGFAMSGADVSGYKGNPQRDGVPCSDPELVTAWMEQGALTPFFRNHGEKGSCRREPWVYGDAALARMRRAAERRYRLLPYLYGAFEVAARTGVPVMRPLWLADPTDPELAREARAYLLGDALLVAPRLSPRIEPYAARLPRGPWFDTTTGACTPGGLTTFTATTGDSVALLARAGAVVPEQPPSRRAGEAPSGALTLHVWPGERCAGEVYADDGRTEAFRAGAWRRLAVTCAAPPPAAGACGLAGTPTGTVRVDASTTGAYPAWWSSIVVVVHDLPAAPSGATLEGGGARRVRYDAATRAATIELGSAPDAFSLSVGW
jgi:alpha-glucosidase